MSLHIRTILTVGGNAIPVLVIYFRSYLAEEVEMASILLSLVTCLSNVTRRFGG